MSDSNSDAVIRLGLDASPLAQGLRGAGQKMEQFAEGMKETAHKARKDFHKAMHEISEESPLVGLALKAALSPIGAALSGGVMLFNFVHSKLEEFNKDMDLQAAAAAKPLGNMQEAFSKAAEAIKKYQKDFTVWLDSHDHTITSITDGLKKQIELLETQKKIMDALVERAKQRAILEGKDPKQIEAAATSLKTFSDYKTLMAERDARIAADKALKEKQTTAKGQIDAAKGGLDSFDMVHHMARESTIKSLEERQKELDAAQAKADEEQSKGAPWWLTGNRGAIKAWEESKAAASERAQASAKQNREMLAKERALQKEEAERLDTLHERLKKAQGQYENYTGQFDTNRTALDSLNNQADVMYAKMDPKQLKENIIKEAFEHFNSAKMDAYRDLLKNHDQKAYANRISDLSVEYNKTVLGADQVVKEMTAKLDAIHKQLTDGILTVQGADR